MIKLKNLSKSYSDTKIVKDLSLEIKDGTIFGFLGPNGAGKTTTMKMIVGLNAPDAGTIEIGDQNPRDLKARENIGYMPEDPYFYEHLTAEEFLRFMSSLFSSLPEQREGSRRSRIRADASALDSSVTSLPQNDTINNILSMVGLPDVGNKKIKDFSKGMKQRLGLAQALVNNPEYLLLDEPLDGLDPIGRLEFKKILLDLKKQGKTIFFNSHILADVEEICDTIGILNHGQLIYSGEVKPFCKNKTLEQRFVELVQEK